MSKNPAPRTARPLPQASAAPLHLVAAPAATPPDERGPRPPTPIHDASGDDAMRRTLAALTLLGASLGATAADLQVGVGINLPGLSIGINLPTYPRMVRVPNHPVYYAPELQGNYFFYDSLYWVLEGDDWYASSWYNGPWDRIRPERVPAYVLQIPVSYYRKPPPYFRGWASYTAPRWDEHWGRQWQTNRPDWNRRDRRNPPVAAPLPTYQQPYARERYPQREQQQDLHTRRYTYQPRDERVREIVQERRAEPSRDDRKGRPDAPDRRERQGRGDKDDRGRGQQR
jgi:hypothetical protein